MSRLTATNVSVSFGSLVVLDAVGVSIGARDRIGIIAPNGVGKSTVLRVLAGDLEPDAGIVTLRWAICVSLSAPALRKVAPGVRPGGLGVTMMHTATPAGVRSPES